MRIFTRLAEASDCSQATHQPHKQHEPQAASGRPPDCDARRRNILVAACPPPSELVEDLART